MEITINQKKLSRKYLTYEFLSNLWFVSAIWLYFYRIFITDQQVGILDASAFAIGLLAEVPSGVLADKFGRARVVKVGQSLVAIGFLIQAFGSSFVPFFVGQTIMMIGAAFVSGADQALFFDKLNFDRESVNWRKLVTRGSQLDLTAVLISTLVGGWLFTINPLLPWILTGLAFLSSIAVIWSIKEIREDMANHKTLNKLTDHLISIKTGFKQFLKPDLLLYIPLIVTVQGLFYAAGWGLLRLVLLDRFYFDPFMGSVVIAASSIATVGILSIMDKRAEFMKEKYVLVLISLVSALSLLFSSLNIGMWGCFIIFALYAGEHILHPFMSEILNNNAPKDKRATVLSVASFLRALPYVGLAPLIGYLNAKGDLHYFLLGWAALIFLSVSTYLLLKKKNGNVRIKEEIRAEGRLPEIG